MPTLTGFGIVRALTEYEENQLHDSLSIWRSHMVNKHGLSVNERLIMRHHDFVRGVR
jgi:hypothetical protein